MSRSGRRIRLILASTFHSKRPLWAARGKWEDKVRALHLSIFQRIAWCAGTRHWMVAELRQLKTLQLRFLSHGNHLERGLL